MTLLTHLVRAHIQRHRWLIIAWLSISLTATVVAAVQPGLAYDPRLYAAVGFAASLLSLAVMIGALVIVPAIVHMDPAVGSDAFWMTRPIPRGTLAVAKILIISAVIVVLPTTAFALVWSTLAVHAADVARASVEALLWGLMWVALLAMAAALTSNIARFALVIGAVVGVAAMALSAAILALRFAAPALPAERPLPPPFDPTPLVVAECILITAAFTVVVAQYRTRRRQVSVPIAAAALVAAYFTLGMWPFPFLRGDWHLPPWAAHGDAPLLAAADGEIAFDRSSFGTQRGTWATGRMSFALDGLPAGWEATTSLLSSRIALENGQVIRGGASGTATLESAGSDESPVSMVARQALDVNRLLSVDPPFEAPQNIVIQARVDDPKGLDGATGSYTGRFAVALSRWEMAGAVPLASRARFQDGAYGFQILDVQKDEYQLIVRAHESHLTSVFDRQLPRAYHLYLRNKGRSEAVSGMALDLSSDVLIGPLFGIHMTQTRAVSNRGVEVRFPASWASDARGMSIGRDWFAAAELVFVRSTQAAVVERTLTVSRTKIVSN